MPRLLLRDPSRSSRRASSHAGSGRVRAGRGSPCGPTADRSSTPSGPLRSTVTYSSSSSFGFDLERMRTWPIGSGESSVRCTRYLPNRPRWTWPTSPVDHSVEEVLAVRFDALEHGAVDAFGVGIEAALRTRDPDGAADEQLGVVAGERWMVWPSGMTGSDGIAGDAGRAERASVSNLPSGSGGQRGSDTGSIHPSWLGAAAGDSAWRGASTRRVDTLRSLQLFEPHVRCTSPCLVASGCKG
jgi:hypothetical protein